jgi:hypothetical protein
MLSSQERFERSNCHLIRRIQFRDDSGLCCTKENMHAQNVSYRGREPSKSAMSTTTATTARRAVRRAIFAPTVAAKSNSGSFSSAVGLATFVSYFSLWQREQVIINIFASGSAFICSTTWRRLPFNRPSCKRMLGEARHWHTAQSFPNTYLFAWWWKMHALDAVFESGSCKEKLLDKWKTD